MEVCCFPFDLKPLNCKWSWPFPKRNKKSMVVEECPTLEAVAHDDGRHPVGEIAAEVELHTEEEEDKPQVSNS